MFWNRFATNSIRFRLTIWIGLIVTIVITVFSAVAFVLVTNLIRNESENYLRQVGKSIDYAYQYEIEEHRAENGPEEVAAIAIEEVTREFKFSDFRILVFDPVGRLKASTAAEQSPDLLFSATKHLGNDALETVRIGNADLRVLVKTEPAARILVIHPLDAEEKLLARIAWGAGTALLVAIVITIFGGTYAVNRSFRPLLTMSSEASTITASSLDKRLEATGGADEIARLAAIINDLLERLSVSFASQRQFLADASHELRTPISVILAESEVALGREDRTAGEYLDSLRSIHQESVAMKRIIEDLMLLTRTENTGFELRITRFDVVELIGSCLDSAAVLASERNVATLFDRSQRVEILADRDLLRGLIRNVLDNAFKYSPAGTELRIDAVPENDELSISFADSGIGVPDDEQSRIFERFYRTSAARGIEGSGLGLAIARRIAEIHGGTLKLLSSAPTGSVFELRLPLRR